MALITQGAIDTIWAEFKAEHNGGTKDAKTHAGEHNGIPA